MTITSNYVGKVLADLYEILFVGNEAIAKVAAALETGVNKTLFLPLLSQSADPIGTYTTGQPGADTVTTTYAERSITPDKMMVYEDINPDLFLSIWEQFQGIGDLTNYAVNPQFLMKVLELYKNNYGTQLSKLFWQGDKTSLTAALAFTNGIITQAIADGNVITTDLNGSGNITIENVAEKLDAVWRAIPDVQMNDPNFKIHMSTTDWKKAQVANNRAKQGQVGFLGQQLNDLFIQNKIEHYAGFPANYIYGAVSSPNIMESNLVAGCYVNPEEEAPKIMLKVNAGKLYFVRVDFSFACTYKVGAETVLYQP